MGGEKDPGDCFKVAAGFATSDYIQDLARATGVPVVLNEKSPFRVVHGLPVGTSGEIAGQRFWHAWVEMLTTEGWVVLEYSNGRNLNLRREDYYRVGQLDETHVWRFTPAEARKLFRHWRHCGPWVPGWREMGDAHGPGG